MTIDDGHAVCRSGALLVWLLEEASVVVQGWGMPDLVTALVPIGSLAAGCFLTMLAQGFSDRRAEEREREERRYGFEVKRYELERETLLALQDALTRHMRLFTCLRFSDSDPACAQRDLTDALSEVIMLNARAVDHDARAAVERYVKDLGDGGAANVPQATTKELFAQAQNAIGTALRRNPFANHER